MRTQREDQRVRRRARPVAGAVPGVTGAAGVLSPEMADVAVPGSLTAYPLEKTEQPAVSSCREVPLLERLRGRFASYLS
jgi:hypothetical protein